jgi:23S rRNA pseudouridine2605 synthase
MERLRRGVELEDGLASFSHLSEAGAKAPTWYRVALPKAAIAKCAACSKRSDLTVSRLMRVRYGPVHLSPRLKRGQCLDLEPSEVQALLKLLPPDQKTMAVADPVPTPNSPILRSEKTRSI